MNHVARVVMVLAVLLASASCGREQSDWRSAREADTIEAYDQFVGKHPEGELATQARTRLAELTEERDWQRISTADTLEGYQQFVAQHPNGKWAREAQIRIENFSLSAQSPAAGPAAAAPAGGTGAGITKGPAAKSEPVGAGTKTAKPAAKPTALPAAPAATAHVRPPVKTVSSHSAKTAHSGRLIQLGAFGSRARADAEWSRLTKAFPQQLAARKPRVTMTRTSTGTLYRLQAPAADLAQARGVCARLKARGHACIVIGL
ncbi:MAG: SPOR domain-containing protein [Steroidobacteraceae bacterium]